jgi:hypothetical protein
MADSTRELRCNRDCARPLGKLDDSLGENHVGVIAPVSPKSRVSHFKCNTHDPLGLGIELLPAKTHSLIHPIHEVAALRREGDPFRW